MNYGNFKQLEFITFFSKFTYKSYDSQSLGPPPLQKTKIATFKVNIFINILKYFNY